ncbi:Protein of unknown function [Nitrosomonas sp. Nm51]|uniref:DUF2914 domain-containing protein n=1 Tax=Nitrosomonas sp. Nm51 TaxID=133720 RepID=UPI0008C03A11|nr:DUF2914 domain-containing protein [Nitrosomonas sp. Nm51]SER80424.1 Protein of unknown function [Nitrosomonas sp. Nm51]
MSDNKLKIRIHIQQPKTSEQGSETDKAEDSISNYDAQTILEKPPLDWRKIAVAATILVAAAGFIGYLLPVLSNSKTAPDDVDFKTEHFTDSTPLYNSFENENAISPLDSLSDATVMPEGEILSGTVEQFTALTGNINMESEATQIITPDSKPGPDEKTASLKPVSKPVSSHNISETQEQSPAPHDNNPIISVSIPANAADHDQIIRAQLTHAVKQREPVDEINQIQLDPNSPRNIYFFVELHDLAGQQVTVNWYFKEQPIAETRLEVNGQNWRTYANKLLNDNSTGLWRVTLTDETGEQLAERHFVVNNNM